MSPRSGSGELQRAQPRPRRLPDNSLRTCASSTRAWAGGGLRSRMPAGRKQPERAGLLKGPAPSGPVRRRDLLMVRAGWPRESGSRQRKSSPSPPPRDDKGGEGCVNSPRGNSGISISPGNNMGKKRLWDCTFWVIRGRRGVWNSPGLKGSSGSNSANGDKAGGP